MQDSGGVMTTESPDAGLIIDFAQLAIVDCPCGTTRRALVDRPESPVSIHRTDIAIDAKTHYHKKQTEVYYILECNSDAAMELNGQLRPIRPGMSVYIPPGVRHRAVGEMKVLVISVPRFNPADEWFD